MFKSCWLLAVGILLAGFSTAHASIIGTYVDADTSGTGNTVRTSDGTDGPTGGWVGTGTTQWNDRNSPPEQGAYLMENNTDPSISTTNSAPEIETTMTGLDPGSIYNIYVIYYTLNDSIGGSDRDANRDWLVQAGLTAGGLTLFDSTDGTYTGTNLVSSPFVINQREGLVGQVSHVASATVFIDDEPPLSIVGIGTIDNRTRYDGVAFEFAGLAPEPASLGMLLIAAPLLARRHRGDTVS